MEFYEYLIGVQDPQFFAISLTVAFRRGGESASCECLRIHCVLCFTPFGTFRELGQDRSRKMFRTCSFPGTPSASSLSLDAGDGVFRYNISYNFHQQPSQSISAEPRTQVCLAHWQPLMQTWPASLSNPISSLLELWSVLKFQMIPFELLIQKKY